MFFLFRSNGFFKNFVPVQKPTGFPHRTGGTGLKPAEHPWSVVCESERCGGPVSLTFLLVPAGSWLLGVWSDLLWHLGGGGRAVLHGLHHVALRHLHRPLRGRALPTAVPHGGHQEARAAGHAGSLDPGAGHLHRAAAGLEAAAVTGNTGPV